MNWQRLVAERLKTAEPCKVMLTPSQLISGASYAADIRPVNFAEFVLMLFWLIYLAAS